MKCDYLLIGQGLAGSTLAYQLLKRGKRIAIIDENKETTSSKVAAGLVNPFTGPKMAKTWLADLLFPFMKNFYQQIERETRKHFFTERRMYRPFTSAGEINDWHGRSTEPEFNTFIRAIREANAHSEFVRDPFGGIESYSAHLDVPEFIAAVSSIICNNGVIIHDKFEEERLCFDDNCLQYDGIEADHVVFCTGHANCGSKYFGWLPMSPLQGEILRVKFEKDFETIYNRSCFIVPLESGEYKVGSTYNRNNLNEETTESGKSEICKKLDALSSMKYVVTGHQAGIRPCTVSRRPFLGTHPEISRIHIFNGLGTKGVTLAPYFSDQMADFLLNMKNPDDEVDIKKYYSLYFKSHF